LSRSIRDPLLAVLGCALIAGAIWFAAVWIDKGDSTCGPVLRPSMWAEDNAPRGCRSTMSVRAGISFLVASSGVAFIVLGLRRGSRPTGSPDTAGSRTATRRP
jgi:hypothetical protein